MNNWRGEVEKTILSGLRAEKNEDELMILLGRKGFELSTIQFSYYKKKCISKMEKQARK